MSRASPSVDRVMLEARAAAFESRSIKTSAKLQDTIDAGVGNLVDADLAKESARLQALSVMQQLAIQALTIANRTPSLLLALFR